MLHGFHMDLKNHRLSEYLRDRKHCGRTKSGREQSAGFRRYHCIAITFGVGSIATGPSRYDLRNKKDLSAKSNLLFVLVMQ